MKDTFSVTILARLKHFPFCLVAFFQFLHETPELIMKLKKSSGNCLKYAKTTDVPLVKSSLK